MLTSGQYQKLSVTASKLKIRPQEFPRILREIGFGDVERRGETGEGGKHLSIAFTPSSNILRQAFGARWISIAKSGRATIYEPYKCQFYGLCNLLVNQGLNAPLARAGAPSQSVSPNDDIDASGLGHFHRDAVRMW